MYKQKYVIATLLLLASLIWAENKIITTQNKDYHESTKERKHENPVNPVEKDMKDYASPDAMTIPKLLNYQGKLTNLTGNPVTDSTYSITFRLFTVSIGGSAFWNETQNVQTNTGLFNVLLGSVSTIESIPQTGNCYLEMQVNPNAAMTPRIRLVSSAYAYLAKKADTASYALSANIVYVDSARISSNAHKLQGKDTIALSAKFVDEEQTNSITNSMIIDNAITSAKIQDGTIQLTDLAFTPVTRPLTPPVSNTEISDDAITSAKIQDGTITRNDVISNFKAPYADTSDYVRNVNIQYVDSARIATNTHKLQNKDTLALSTKFVDEGQANSIATGMVIDSAVTSPKLGRNAVTSDKIQDGTITRTDVVSNFKAPYSDTADYARVVPAIDSVRISVNAYNAYKLQGKDTIALSAKFVDEGQLNSVSSTMIQDGSIIRNDVASDFKSPYSDTAEYARVAPAIDSARVAANAHNADKLQGKDTSALDTRYVNEGQINSITSAMIQDGTVDSVDIKNNVVTNSKLAPNSVSTDKILNGSISTDDIEDGAITNYLLDRDAVTSSTILDSTITRADVKRNFKAPYADTADYTRNVNVAYVDSARISANTYNAYKLQGKDTIALSAKYIDEGQLNSISSPMIIDNTITRNDVATNFKAPFSDTSDYARNANVQYVDSARISANAHKLQGKDTIALSAKFVDEGQTNAVTNNMIVDNAVTSSKIQDGTISRNDVTSNFKAPYSDTSDYARNAPAVDSVRIAATAYNAYKLQGKDTIALSAKFVDEGQANSVSSAMITDNTITRNDVATNFKSPYADTSDYARNTPAVDSVRIAATAYNAYKLQGKDTTALSAKFIDEGQSAGGDLTGTYPNPTITTNAVTSPKILDGAVTTAKIADLNVTTAKITDGAVNSAKILDGTIIASDIRDTTIITAKIKDTAVTMPKIARAGAATGQVIKWTGTAWLPRPDSATGAPVGPAGGDLTGTYPNPTITTNAVTTAKILDTAVTMAKVARAGASTGQVIKWTGSAWAPRTDSVGIADNAWVRGTPDSVLFTIRQLGIARGGAQNMLWGTYRQTHTNLGVACTTGTSGQDNPYATVGGGHRNKASLSYATVGGGGYNIASGSGATVGGGTVNQARGAYSVVSGGGGVFFTDSNSAMGRNSTIGGGIGNIASGDSATISGGARNKASSINATVGGGLSNTASNDRATVGGGYQNTARTLPAAKLRP